MITTEHRKAAAKLAQRLLKARTDFTTFVEVVVRNDHGDHLDLATFHRQWITHVDYCWQRGLHCLLIAPFGHGKTSSFAVPLIAWMMGRDPNTRAKIVTNEDGSATKRVGLAKSIIESASFRAVFPTCVKGDKWSEHELFLKRGGLAVDPSLQARGIFTKGIGGRADLVLFDDVVDQLNSADAEQRKKVLAIVEGTWLSRLEPDARVLYVGTPWHLDDATTATN